MGADPIFSGPMTGPGLSSSIVVRPKRRQNKIGQKSAKPIDYPVGKISDKNVRDIRQEEDSGKWCVGSVHMKRMRSNVSA